jgi:hypothetical protein
MFEKPGIIPVFCEIHYSMRAYIHVVETPYFAVSDENGNFIVHNVPKGIYSIEVWQEGQPNIKVTADVSADSTWLELK